MMRYLTVFLCFLLFACNKVNNNIENDKCYECFYNLHNKEEKEAIDKMHKAFDDILELNYNYNYNFSKAGKIRAYTVGYIYDSKRVYFDSTNLKEALDAYKKVGMYYDSVISLYDSKYLQRLLSCLKYDYQDSMIFYYLDSYRWVGDINPGGFLDYTAFDATNEVLERKMFQHIFINEFFARNAERILSEGSKIKEQKFMLDYIKVDTSINKNLTDLTFSNEIVEKLPGWISFYSDLNSDFDLNGFKNTETEVVEPYQVSLGSCESFKNFIDLYNPYLKWSPDSKKAIDLYSYSIVLEKDKNGTITGMRDVDCQLAIIDKEEHKRIVLYTYGHAMEFQDALWLNKDSLIVTMGSYSFSYETVKPYYIMIDLNTYLVREYKFNKSYKIDGTNYLDNVFKNVQFD